MTWYFTNFYETLTYASTGIYNPRVKSSQAKRPSDIGMHIRHAIPAHDRKWMSSLSGSHNRKRKVGD
jgi:hypothetical protein